MALFSKLFNKKMYSDTDVVSPVKGRMIPCSEINDAVFSQEMMGQTIGIEPCDGVVCSPVNGVIEAMFPTHHAFGIKTANGTGYLVHIGIDTVALNGEGFKAFAKQGDSVKAGQKIVVVDMDKVKKVGYPLTTMLIVTDKPSEDFKVNYIDYKDVERAEIINLN